MLADDETSSNGGHEPYPVNHSTGRQELSLSLYAPEPQVKCLTTAQ